MEFRYDANISLPGCDKNMPGTVMAMARLNRPAIMIYGGTIQPGKSKLDGSTLDIVSAFQSYGETSPFMCPPSKTYGDFPHCFVCPSCLTTCGGRSVYFFAGVVVGGADGVCCRDKRMFMELVEWKVAYHITSGPNTVSLNV